MILISFCPTELTEIFYWRSDTHHSGQLCRRAWDRGEKFGGKIRGTKQSFGLQNRKADLGNGGVKKYEMWMRLYFLGKGCGERDGDQAQQQQDPPEASMTPGKPCRSLVLPVRMPRQLMRRLGEVPAGMDRACCHSATAQPHGLLHHPGLWSPFATTVKPVLLIFV